MELSHGPVYFNTKEEALDSDLAKNCGKSDFIECSIDCNPTFLCGTCLVFEDPLWTTCREFLDTELDPKTTADGLMAIMYDCFDLTSFKPESILKVNLIAYHDDFLYLTNTFKKCLSTVDPSLVDDLKVDYASRMRDVVIAHFESFTFHKIDYISDSY